MNYIAVIGDVISSRETADRSALQERLQAAISVMNELFRASLASSFVLTLGDEFQGLLKAPEELARLLARCRVELFPTEVRFGIGVGPLDTPLEPLSLGMDGPCFHRAREAVERASNRETYVEVSTTGDSTNQPVFSIYALLSAALRRRWTERQRHVVDLTMAGLEGKEIAARLAITPSAVSQHLRAAGASAIMEATQDWQDALGHGFSV
ncbi:MAG: SatD family protein [Chloroflexota bacterium]